MYVVITPDGVPRYTKTLRRDNEDFLQTLYRVIGCHAVDVIALPGDIDMWCDDEGLLKANPQLNATASRLYGGPLVGTVVLAAHDEMGHSTPLSERQFVALHAVLTGRPDGP